jgi:sigma-B regulation protein RsbU (phosphoserine phosphatase)
MAGPGTRSSVGRRREMLSTGTTALKNAIDLTNNYIARNHSKANMFATVFFGLLDPATGSLVYINAGHEPPLLIGNGEVKARLNPTGPAVGLLPGLDFSFGQVEMASGDILLAFTDGVPDARDPAGQFFGEENLHELLRLPAGSAGEFLDYILASLAKHIAGAAQFDDITLLAARRETD